MMAAALLLSFAALLLTVCIWVRFFFTSLGIVGEGCVREVPVGYHDFDFDFGECLMMRILMMAWLVVGKLIYYWELM